MLSRIPLDKIVVNPEIIARVKVDEEYLATLMKSLKEDGQLHPITVRPLPDGRYELIDGLHRVEAAKRLGWRDIEAYTIDVDEVEAKFLALKANILRRSLEPVEEGEVIYRIMVKHGLDEKSVAEKLGVKVKWVSERLALVLKVHEDVKKLVKEGKLSLGHAVIISKIEDPEKQLRFAELILKNGWSVKQAEEALVEFLNDTIYTIGYEGRNIDEFIDLLKKHEIKVVIDTRHETEFVKPAFSEESLKAHLKYHGVVYVKLDLLGVPKIIREPYIERKLPFECFKQWYLWWIERSRSEWEKTIREAKKIGPIVIMCVERYPKPKGDQKHYCHRDILASYLIQQGFFEKRVDIE
jgi:ParB family chromosome partitioning protein